MLKKVLRFLIEPIVILTMYVAGRVRQESSLLNPNVMGLVRQLALIDSAEFVNQNIYHAALFDSREKLWDAALAKVRLRGLYLEFGVWEGYSINYFANLRPDEMVVGFDSFEGLAEDWSGTNLLQGHFDLGGKLPTVSSNVRLVPGWFKETIPVFVQKNRENVAFLHLDADTYEATHTVLTLLGERLVPGSIIVLDEHHGYPNWRNGEFRALNEFASLRDVRIRYLGFSEMAAVVEVMA
jgi:hypothetical protein